MSLRRGACPTLAAPMLTGDGWLARLAVEGLTPGQLGGLARAAGRFGNGRIEVTARGSLQVRGLTPETAVELDAAVADLGIAVEAGVPLLTGALAGLDPEEVADPRPLAAAIRERARGLVGRLAPKVSVVVDGGGRLHLDAVKADVRLVAGGAGWRVEVGGTAVAVGDASAAVEVAMAMLERLADSGTRGRDLAVTGAALPARTARAPAVPVGRLPGAVGFGLPFGQTESGVLVTLADAAPAACVFRPAAGAGAGGDGWRGVDRGGAGAGAGGGAGGPAARDRRLFRGAGLRVGGDRDAGAGGGDCRTARSWRGRCCICRGVPSAARSRRGRR